jgi:hypothetical protein
MRCPHCKTDIRQAMILAWAGTIVAKRRRRAGNTITSDEARAMQAKSAAARRGNRDAQAAE